MEENKIFVERKDGIKYYRKSSNYNYKLMIRINENMHEDLQKIAEESNMNCTNLVRHILDDYITTYKVAKEVENNE